jgi:hypothetical protein
VNGVQTIAGGGGASASCANNSYPFFVYRIWFGMRVSILLPLLAHNHFAVSPSRAAFALRGFVCALVNSSANVAQKLIFGKRIRDCVLDAPPIFIIGHWRTGTTLLHELLTLDERFTAPSTIECFAPSLCHALGWLLRRFTFFLPANRPMDNMRVGWDHPQEDEFALMNLGLGSPYEAMIFPNHPRARHSYLNMTALTPQELAAWKDGFLSFLQQVNLRSRREQKYRGRARRIVLKSPTHTARLHILREMFPGAKFIHIVRDPCEVFSSTVRLWRALFDTQGCQKPQFEGGAGIASHIEEYVFENMDLLYRDFFAEVGKIPAENFCELRYEDLVGAPEAELSRIYRELQLESFEQLRPKLKAHLRGLRGYKANGHRISDQQRSEVSRRWGWYMDRFGYRAPVHLPTARPQDDWDGARELIPL